MNQTRKIEFIIRRHQHRQRWIAESLEFGIWTEGKNLNEATKQARSAAALALDTEPSDIQVELTPDCPQLTRLADARAQEQIALNEAVTHLRSINVPWGDTARLTGITQSVARQVWHTANPSPDFDSQPNNHSTMEE